MLSEIRKGCIAEGLALGIRDVGFVLAEHFPRGGGRCERVARPADRSLAVLRS